ncbi:MAG: hypothetical protein ABJA67_05200 [Chthonomonadales bacterium]
MISILLTLSMLASSSGRYELLPDTTSPDKHYAVAWGIKGRKSVDFDALWKDDVKVKPEEWIGNVENYIVDLRSKSVVLNLKGCADFRGRNHGSTNAFWSADSHRVVVSMNGKWQPEAIVLATLGGSDQKIVNISDTFFGTIRSRIMADFDRRKENREKTIAVAFSQSEHPTASFGPNSVTLPFYAYQPKIGDGWQCSGTITIPDRLKSARAKVKISSRLHWYRETTYKGFLDPNLQIEMTLKEQPEVKDGIATQQTLYSGSYFYIKDHQPITLKGITKDDDGTMLLNESVNGKPTGKFDGKLDGHGGLSGKWISPDGKRTRGFLLKEVSHR